MATLSGLVALLVVAYLLYLVSRMARWLFAFFAMYLLVVHPLSVIFLLLLAAGLYFIPDYLTKRKSNHAHPKLPDSRT